MKKKQRRICLLSHLDFEQFDPCKISEVSLETWRREALTPSETCIFEDWEAEFKRFTLNKIFLVFAKLSGAQTVHHYF